MARAAVQSMSEIETERRLDDLQETLSWLGMIPGFGIVFDIVNVQISVARGNYDDAKLYAVLALPYVGTVAGVALLGYALGQYLVADSHSAASQAEDPNKMLNPVYRVPWVSGRGGGNSFAAVTGVDENGNPITTNIEDLQIGDVVLSGNELDPSDPNHYALVTEVHSKTVYEQTQLTYVDDAGNIEVIKTTDNHEFYVEGTGWTTAAELQAGAILTLSDGQTATVLGTQTIAIPEGLTVYNLTVSDGSTYFVDEGQGSVSAVWVHNRIRIKRWGVGKYGQKAQHTSKFRLDKHEILQHAWLKAHGSAKKARLYSNPVIGLSKSFHKKVTARQRELGLLDPKILKKMSGKDIIKQNVNILKDLGAPKAAIKQLQKNSLEFLKTLKKVK
jgi:filamentous hemagglutinin